MTPQKIGVYVVMAPGVCLLYSRLVLLVADVDVCAELHQAIDALHVAAVGRQVACRVTICRLQIRVCAKLHQQSERD